MHRGSITIGIRLIFILALVLVSCAVKPKDAPPWAYGRLTYYITESGEPFVTYLRVEHVERIREPMEKFKGFELTHTLSEAMNRDIIGMGALVLTPVLLVAGAVDLLENVGDKECLFELDVYETEIMKKTYRLCKRKPEKWYVIINSEDFDITPDRAVIILKVLSEVLSEVLPGD